MKHMKINKIHIRNFRAYKDFECEFSDGINLVIGDNGTGKTSLLAAVTQLLSVQVFTLGGGLNVDPIDPHLEIEKAGDATLSTRECFPIEISGKITDENRSEHEFEIVRNSYGSSNLKGDTTALSTLIEKDETIWPLINYQRFDRDWKAGKNTGKTVSVDTGLNERKDGYKGCLSGNGQEDTIQKWCLKMSMLEFERKDKIREFERFKYIIKSFLQSIEEDDEEFEVNYSLSFSGLVMEKGDTIQPLYELSTGYKALLSMIMELAYRSVLLNPKMDIDDDNQTGIVIIDEIDAHLHPKWQWRVIDSLKKCFPKVQFIIATHSPIVIASSKDARIIDLEEKGKVSYSDGAYGYNVADVLELKQGSISVSKISAGYMKRLENALDKDDLAEADKTVAEALTEFGENSPVYAELRNYLEVNRWAEDN